MTKLIVDFRNFENAPKMGQQQSPHTDRMNMKKFQDQCVLCSVIKKSVRALHFHQNHCYYVEIKFQLDATDVFIADLIACSTCFGHHYAHHQEFKSLIQWLLPVVFRAVVFQVAGLVWS